MFGAYGGAGRFREMLDLWPIVFALLSQKSRFVLNAGGHSGRMLAGMRN